MLAVIVLFWHPVFSWLYRGQKLFIDKYCIHQSDVQGRTNPGVTRLPLFLQHSQKLLVLFDSEYTTRLWCVWELAIYSRLRETPKIVFISMDRMLVEFLFLILSILTEIVVFAVQDSTSSTVAVLASIVARSDYNMPYPDPDGRLGTEISVWIAFWYFIIENIMVYLLAERYYNSLHKLRSSVAEFDVASTHLAIEKDRPLLLGIVDELFQSSPRNTYNHDEIQASGANPDEIQASGEPSGEPSGQPLIDGHQLEVRLQQHASGNSVPSPIRRANEGLAEFNRSVGENVEQQLPMTGVRSINLFGYSCAVVIAGSRLAFRYYDSWGYITTGEQSQAVPADWVSVDETTTVPYRNWRSIVGLAYFILVLGPFLMFHYSIWMWAFLKLHEWSRLPRWTNYAIFLPILLCFKNVMWLDYTINANLENMLFADLIAGTATPHQFTYIPFFGLTYAFLFVYHDYSKPVPQWYYGFTWTFQKNALTDSLLWVFLVIPLTIFTYWVYEPNVLRRYRAKCWKFIVQKLFASKDRSRSDSRV